jgi:predicted GTPase
MTTGVTRRVVILGAAGRDFHNFNVVFRDDPATRVEAFTGAQIPGITDRRYPPALAGERYPEGIPIIDEAELPDLAERHPIDEVVFAYSDVSHREVMTAASRALALGADFRLLGPERTMLRAAVPVVAVSAVRTGCGKSQIARAISAHLRERGHDVAVVRHPMPYGDLAAQAAQRFASREDLDRADCTVEEREEYEPHLEAGAVVFAGVDYAQVIEQAEAEGDVIVWDGGNNDFPFVRPDLHIVVADALRPHDVVGYYPGEAVIQTADVVIVNKVDAASSEQLHAAIEAVRSVNHDAELLRAASPVTLDDPDAVRGRDVLVVDDGPTLTHGGMPYGAGYVAAVNAGARPVDPRDYAHPEITAALDRFPHLHAVLPALGYDEEQLAALEATIGAAAVDVVVSGTPVDLTSLIDVPQRIVRARYQHQDVGSPTLGEVIDRWVARSAL